MTNINFIELPLLLMISSTYLASSRILSCSLPSLDDALAVLESGKPWPTRGPADLSKVIISQEHLGAPIYWSPAPIYWSPQMFLTVGLAKKWKMFQTILFIFILHQHPINTIQTMNDALLLWTIKCIFLSLNFSLFFQQFSSALTPDCLIVFSLKVINALVGLARSPPSRLIVSLWEHGGPHYTMLAGCKYMYLDNKFLLKFWSWLSEKVKVVKLSS